MPELVRAVADEGYASPTPVQAQAIPVILEGRDVLAGAQTGTGKTAGFTLPLLQRLASRANASPSPARHPIRALVLTPTRELAAQVEESIRTYGKHLRLRTTLVYGGVGINPQIDALRRGVDILVATPGRLLDHVGQKTVDLRHVEILVLDEADRMLDMGFIRDIRRILALLPAQRQNLLFSATFSDEIRSLANGLLRDPAMVQVARRNAESELVAQRVYPVPQPHKRALLAHLVSAGDWRQVLVFTRTKHGANRLAEQLCKDGIEATAIHGNKSQGARTKALAGFKAGEVRVLVATDLASRGLDIVELPHVVNYELPHVPEDYVHRIGRTGRAGSEGEAISLVSPDEAPLLADIEKLLKRKLERTPAPEFERRASTPVEPRPQARPREGMQARRQRPRDAAAQPRDAAAQPRHRPARDPNAQSHRQPPRDPDAQPGYEGAHAGSTQPRRQTTRDADAQPRHRPMHDPDAQPRHAAAHEANAWSPRQPPRESHARKHHQPAHPGGAHDHQEPAQPASHESALGRLHDHARRAPRSGGRRDGPVPALLRGTPRRTN
jgi:ATP-dependent RNA helicase RhlE